MGGGKKRDVVLRHYRENVVQRVGSIGEVHRFKQLVQSDERVRCEAVNNFGYRLCFRFESSERIALRVGNVGEAYEYSALYR